MLRPAMARVGVREAGEGYQAVCLRGGREYVMGTYDAEEAAAEVHDIGAIKIALDAGEPLDQVALNEGDLSCWPEDVLQSLRALSWEELLHHVAEPGGSGDEGGPVGPAELEAATGERAAAGPPTGNAGLPMAIEVRAADAQLARVAVAALSCRTGFLAKWSLHACQGSPNPTACSQPPQARPEWCTLGRRVQK